MRAAVPCSWMAGAVLAFAGACTPARPALVAALQPAPAPEPGAAGGFRVTLALAEPAEVAVFAFPASAEAYRLVPSAAEGPARAVLLPAGEHALPAASQPAFALARGVQRLEVLIATRPPGSGPAQLAELDEPLLGRFARAHAERWLAEHGFARCDLAIAEPRPSR